MEPANTRSEKRRQLFYYLKVFRADTGDLLGNLVDLTRSGIMLLSRDPIEVGWEGGVRIILPTQVAGRDDLVMTVQARWNRRDVNPEYYLTGLQLTAATDEALAIIDFLIATYGFQG